MCNIAASSEFKYSTVCINLAQFNVLIQLTTLHPYSHRVYVLLKHYYWSCNSIPSYHFLYLEQKLFSSTNINNYYYNKKIESKKKKIKYILSEIRLADLTP